MIPPICSICFKRFIPKKNGGKLLSFKLTEEDKVRKAEMTLKRMVGHPDYRKWFCSNHVSFAKPYVHLHAVDALKKIKEDLLSEETGITQQTEEPLLPPKIIVHPQAHLSILNDSLNQIKDDLKELNARIEADITDKKNEN